MTIDVLIEEPGWAVVDLEMLAAKASDVALQALGLDPEAWDISLLGCNDTRISELNGDFREKPTPTNVLSWPSEERGAAVDGETPLPPIGPDPELGDIAIALETCQREALEAGKSLPDHVTHLLIHGVLHLLGYDHIRDLDATLMEGLETSVLGKMGISDPYRENNGV